MGDITDLPILHDIDAGYRLVRIFRSEIMSGGYGRGMILSSWQAVTQ